MNEIRGFRMSEYTCEGKTNEIRGFGMSEYRTCEEMEVGTC